MTAWKAGLRDFFGGRSVVRPAHRPEKTALTPLEILLLVDEASELAADERLGPQFDVRVPIVAFKVHVG